MLLAHAKLFAIFMMNSDSSSAINLLNTGGQKRYFALLLTVG